MNNKKMLANVLKLNKVMRKRVRQEESLLKRIEKVNADNQKLGEKLANMVNIFSDVKIPEQLPA